MPGNPSYEILNFIQIPRNVLLPIDDILSDFFLKHMVTLACYHDTTFLNFFLLPVFRNPLDIPRDLPINNIQSEL